MKISEFQKHIWHIYGHHDKKRGIWKTYLWLKREVEELGEAIFTCNKDNIKEEIADVLAWLTSISTLLNVDLQNASIERYGEGCPKCGYIPCQCIYREK